MGSKKSRPTLGVIIFLILGFLHILLPVWGIVVPDIMASFFWYWGFYIAGGGGTFDTGIISNEEWLSAGRTAMILMIICYVILTITFIIVKIKKTFKTEKNLNIFGIIWLILGIILLIAPSIYLAAVGDSPFDEYSWGVGIFFSYGLACVPLLLGIFVLYSQMKGEKVRPEVTQI
ncbi:MAG: hypothetical protein KGD58_13975 [Candidatus Lokiarchaeota archaeon]|nr:hypothetical protein [Candidatus Lokiarchaeota archaeon]